MQPFISLLHLVFVGFVALFPPVNPIGTALIVDPLLRGLNAQERRSASFKIALYCFSICAGTLLVGSWLFKLFGISLPVVQIAGGLLICQMGWKLLSSDENHADAASQPASSKARNPLVNVENILFYPLAFPMTTGAGTISVLLTLSARGHSVDLAEYSANLVALFVAVLLMVILIYLSFAYTPTLLRRLGPSGEQIVNRLSAFLVFCVGIQIATGGITHLIAGTN